jgi:tetratricopeptide (TPR) repeat protein
MQAATQAAATLETQKRDALEELVSQQLARGRLSDAEGTANELVRIAPHWAESYNARGGVLLKRGKLAQAESDFRAALRLAPNQPVYMNNIGLAVHRRGKRKEAIEWFEKAATTDPTFATARKNLSASTGLYLWGDAFVIVFSIAIHAAYAGLGGSSNGRNPVLLLIGILALIVPVVLVRYWLRRRSLDPIARTIYKVEARRAWRRPDTRTMVRAGGLLVLLAAFLVALFTNQTQLETLFVILAILWLHRGWTLWRFASGLFHR